MPTQYLDTSTYAEVLASLPQTIFEVSDAMEIVSVNRPTSPIFLRAVGDNEPLMEVVSADAADAIVSAVDIAERTGGAVTQYRAEGEVYGVSARKLASVSLILVVVEHATSLDSRSESVRKILRDHDRFVSVVRQELETPLSAVVGIAELLLKREFEFNPETGSGLVRHLTDQANDLTQVLEDLSAALDLELGSFSPARAPFDLLAATVQVVAGFQSAGAAVTFTGSRELEGMGDPVHYRQVVRSVVRDAIARGEGGTRLRLTEENGMAVLHVEGEDTSTDSARPGPEKPAGYPPTPRRVGLSLWVAEQICDAMGGSLEYRHQGRETVFRVAVPLSDVQA